MSPIHVRFVRHNKRACRREERVSSDVCISASDVRSGCIVVGVVGSANAANICCVAVRRACVRGVLVFLWLKLAPQFEHRGTGVKVEEMVGESIWEVLDYQHTTQHRIAIPTLGQIHLHNLSQNNAPDYHTQMRHMTVMFFSV